MPKVVVETVIDKPIEDVFDYVADQAKTTKWCLALTECRLTNADRMEPGARRVVARKALGMSFDWEFECTNFERPNALSWRSVGGRLPMDDIYEFESLENGTLVRHIIEPKPTGFLRFLGPIVTRKSRKDMVKDLAALKSLLEN